MFIYNSSQDRQLSLGTGRPHQTKGMVLGHIVSIANKSLATQVPVCQDVKVLRRSESQLADSKSKAFAEPAEIRELRLRLADLPFGHVLLQIFGLQCCDLRTVGPRIKGKLNRFNFRDSSCGCSVPTILLKVN